MGRLSFRSDRGPDSVENMTVRLQSVNHSQHASRSRALAYVLLILIGFSSTVGLAHRHGLSTNLSQTRFSLTETNASPTINVPPSTTQDPVQSGDCLVCHFQQSLSSAEIFTPVVLAALTGSASVIQTLSASFLSRTQSIAQGRAPPTTF